jgi:hypothetical protein
MMQRRAFLTGIGAVIASPAIVRASSLMPVKVWRDIGPRYVWGSVAYGSVPFDQMADTYAKRLMLSLIEHRERAAADIFNATAIPSIMLGAA